MTTAPFHRGRWFTAVLFFALIFVSESGAGDTQFGHRAYPVAPADTLVEVGPYRDTGRLVRLRAPAALAFRNMARAARAESVGIVPISGFRTAAYQEGLWTRALARYGSPKAAARWVAPPGFSEHHTGWALDMGDENARETDVAPGFGGSPAYRWLSCNAHRFGFELSFPKDNPQGVSREPWHWRYIGDEPARRLFHPEK